MKYRLAKLLSIMLIVVFVVYTLLANIVPSKSTIYATTHSVYINTTTGDDNQDGSSTAPVKTLEKALTLAHEGSEIHVTGKVIINTDIVVDKNLTLVSNNISEPQWIIENNGSLSAPGKTITFKATVRPRALLQIKGTLKDGTYVADTSTLSKSDLVESYFLALTQRGKIEGSSKENLIINSNNTQPFSSFTNSDGNVIKTTLNVNYTQDIGTIKTYNRITMSDSDFNVRSTALGFNRLGFYHPINISNSTWNIDLPNAYANDAIIFNNNVLIQNSNIQLNSYGLITITPNRQLEVNNTSFKVDGITRNEGNPKQQQLLYPVSGKTVAVKSTQPDTNYPKVNSEVRMNFMDERGNRFDYGLPHNHGHVNPVLNVPAYTLTFTGDINKEVLVPFGMSLESLNNKVYLNNELFKTDFIPSLSEDKTLKMTLPDGSDYTLNQRIEQDTTVNVKIEETNVNGIRYHLNIGDNHMYFEKDATSVLSFEDIKKQDSRFTLRSKKFIGWATDAEGNNIIEETFQPANRQELYAVWEDKKQFNVTYVNTPNSRQSDTTEINIMYYEGELLAGVLVDTKQLQKLVFSDLIPSYWAMFPETHSHQKTNYPTLPGGFSYGNVNDVNDWGRFNYLGNPSFLNILTGNFSGLLRTLAWSTTPNGAYDQTGKLYRGGHQLTAEDYMETGGTLRLYNQWIDLDYLYTTARDNIANPDKARPNITLAGAKSDPSDYEKAKDAFVVDHSQTLNYKAHLVFDNLKTELTTLWARIEEVSSWDGFMNAYFDSRLQFDDNVDILFESTWLQPDEAKLDELGITVRPGDTPDKFIFTISKEKIMENKVKRTNTDTDFDASNLEYYKASIPVKMIPKYDPNQGKDFQKLSFDDFMKPMTLTVAGNEKRGINGIITRESLNSIATSEKPILIVGGEIDLTIRGFEMGGIEMMNFRLKSNAYDEHAKAYTAGNIIVDYQEVGTALALSVETNDDEDLDHRLTISEYEGRSFNPSITIDDANNYYSRFKINTDNVELSSEKGDITIEVPRIAGYRFVGIKDNKENIETFDHTMTKYFTLLYEKDEPTKQVDQDQEEVEKPTDQDQVVESVKPVNIEKQQSTPIKKDIDTSDSSNVILLTILLVGSLFVLKKISSCK